jgi:hypothetical protein
MIFGEPRPFEEAIQSRLARTLLPTDLRSQLLSQIPPALKERMFFVSGMTRADELTRVGESIDDILLGSTTRDAQRAKLKLLVDQMGAPALSDARLNLILDTNVQMAEGFGSFVQGQGAGVLDAWPAQELVRMNVPKVPRDWPDRWETAGGELVDGDRMVAAKDDDLWNRLGDPDLFDDGLGNPYPPFAFNSGMDVADVTREEAERLGVIDPDQQIAADDRGLNQDLAMNLETRDAELKAAVLDTLQGVARLVKGVLRFTGAGA